MIPVHVAGLSFSNAGFVVLLRGSADERTLPVFIGPAEAQAIAFHLEQVQTPRPMTHDLFKSVLDTLGCRVTRVEVTALTNSTFYGRLLLQRDGVEFEIDARPSDAIALALRAAAPIYVAESVMEQAGVVLGEDAEKGAAAAPRAAAPRAQAPEASPLQKLQVALQKAVEDERYEDAARLRDEIARLPHPRTAN